MRRRFAAGNWPEAPVTQRPPDAREMGYYIALAYVGLEMVVPIILGLVVDRYAGSAPWCLVAGAVLGLCGGLAHLVHQLNRKESGKASRPGRDSR